MKKIAICLLLASAAGSTGAIAASSENPQDTPKAMSGMSILGNSEAPKSLVIVPWKTSEIGDGIGVSNMLDGRARPVDKEVFIRELDYYQLRTGAAGQSVPKKADSRAGAGSLSQR